MVSKLKSQLGWFGLGPPFDPSFELVTSYFISPFNLAVLRLTIAVYTFVALLFDIIWQGVVLHTDKTFFTYFTELSYIGICAYFWASGVQTLAYAIPRRRHQKSFYSNVVIASYPLQRWPQFLQFLHVWLLSTILTFPIVVSVTFWSLLSSSLTFSTAYYRWHNITIHAMNCLYVVLELIFGRTRPWSWNLLPINILVLGGYLGIAYITHKTQGYYTYAFLDPHTEGDFLAVYIIGIALGEVVVFAIVWGICAFREKMFGHCGGKLLQDESELKEVGDI